MGTDALSMEVVAEPTLEGQTLFRAEVRRSDGTLVDASLPTIHPRLAIAHGCELLDKARSDEAFREARYEAAALFTHAA